MSATLPSSSTPPHSIPGYPLGHVDILILNEREGTSLISALTPTASPSTPMELIQELQNQLKIGQIVLTLGALGALYIADGAILQIDAVSAPHVVDTTGAGDTFIGYFVAGLAADRSPGQALNLAATAAAICVTRAGAMNSIPHADELDFPSPG